MDPQFLVSHYHETFEVQRNNINTELSKRPGFAEFRIQSERQFGIILNGLQNLGLNPSNAIFAIDGSFSYYMGTPESDIEGTIYLLSDASAVTLEPKVDHLLSRLHRESSIYVISKNWRPTRDDTLAMAHQIGEAVGIFLSGRYIWGSFDQKCLLQLISNAEPKVLDELNKMIESRFYHMYEERFQTYTERLKRFQRGGMESKE